VFQLSVPGARSKGSSQALASPTDQASGMSQLTADNAPSQASQVDVTLISPADDSLLQTKYRTQLHLQVRQGNVCYGVVRVDPLCFLDRCR